MQQGFVLSIFGLFNLFRGLFFPILRGFFIPLNSTLRARFEFELRNLVDPQSKSFKSDGDRAWMAFEVSSEGELEQVRPLLDHFLNDGKKIELIYASESVEGKCQKLAQEYENLRVFRLPILSLSYFSSIGGQRLEAWVTAPTLVFCRYDFYPELLALKSRCSFILVSGSLKGKETVLEDDIGFKHLYYKSLYSFFETIIAASRTDQDKFNQLGIESAKLIPFDFRTLQILKRTKNASQALDKYIFFDGLKRELEKVPMSKRIIMGSAWPLEIELLKDPKLRAKILSGELFFSIAPHSLKAESVAQLEQVLREIAPELPIYKVCKDVAQKPFAWQTPGITLITVPGILCELYTYYGQAFIGGGHGRSIHSVLEPYLAGCRVFCGPGVHRSTEYDFLHSNSPHFVHIVENLEEFYSLLINLMEKPLLDHIRQELMQEAQGNFQEIIETRFMNAR